MKNLANFNLQQLYYFFVVAKEGSIKAAARKLHVTQPAISLRIKNLEDELDTPLFERNHRKIELNFTGRQLFKYADEIFDLTQKALISVTEAEKPKGKLRAGIIPSISKAAVHDVLRPLWKKDLILHVSQGNYTELHDQMARDKLDVMIVDSEPRYRPGWTIEEIDQRRLIFAGAPKFKNVKNQFPASLNSVPLIAFTENNALSIELNRFLANHKINPEIVGEIDDFSLLLSFLIDGVAIGVVSHRVAQQYLDNKLLVNIGEMKNYISRLWLVKKVASQ